jgi:hypothetical protein
MEAFIDPLPKISVGVNKRTGLPLPYAVISR